MNTQHIQLDNLEATCRGDQSRVRAYLLQFLKLIPERVEQLTAALEEENRVLVRKILHKMSPQLQFFGIKDVITPIQRLEFEYETMPYDELAGLTKNIIVKLEVAVKEVAEIINANH